MVRALTAAVLLSAMALLSAPAALAKEKTPPGSFLEYRVRTVGELVDQVSKYPTVKARYARHFGIRPQEVAGFLSDGLRLVSLKSPEKVRSWYIGKSGDAYSKTKLLPKGTQVFVAKDGKPLLSWSCGNPLRDRPAQQAAAKGAPPTPAPAAASTETAESAASQVEAVSTEAPATMLETAAIETKVLAQPVETIGADPVATLPETLTNTESALPEMPEPLVVAQLPTALVLPAVANPIAPMVSSGISALHVLGGLAGVLGGFTAIRPNKTPTVEPVFPPREPPIGAVPEPSGLVLLTTAISSGIAYVGMARRRAPRA